MIARELIEPAQVGRGGDGTRFQFTIQVPDVDRVCFNYLDFQYGTD
jgi:hypothetical protein